MYYKLAYLFISPIYVMFGDEPKLLFKPSLSSSTILLWGRPKARCMTGFNISSGSSDVSSPAGMVINRLGNLVKSLLDSRTGWSFLKWLQFFYPIYVIFAGCGPRAQASRPDAFSESFLLGALGTRIPLGKPIWIFGSCEKGRVRLVFVNI